MEDLRVAIVHDWLTGMRGGERVLEAVCRIFPQADLFTLVHLRGKISAGIERQPIKTSFIQRLPAVDKYYRHYLPLFPLAIEQFDLSSYQLVLSLSHCVALGVVTRPECCHICYCFTPMRYVWDQYWHYFGTHSSGLKRMIVAVTANYLRQWDATVSQRVDYFLTTSRHVSRRIWKYYRRQSTVINPGVDTDYFAPHGAREDFFLIVSALSPYKRLDLAVEACNRLRLPLVVIGWGPEEKRLKRISGPTIQWLGEVSDAVLCDYYARCRALIFPGEEDFGLTPLEAQAAGAPVIAYARGGVLETVIPETTGIFFSESASESLMRALERFQTMKFDANIIARHASGFSLHQFEKEFGATMMKLYQTHNSNLSRIGNGELT